MIGRITNQMAAQTTLAGIESALDRLDTTQQELSTGKSINQPSDNPSGTALTLQLNNDLSNLTSYNEQRHRRHGLDHGADQRAVGHHQRGPARSRSSCTKRPTALRTSPI